MKKYIYLYLKLSYFGDNQKIHPKKIHLMVCHHVQNLFNERQRISFLFNNYIEFSKIHTNPQLSIFFDTTTMGEN
jgi:hypothetical protein